jgi:hypothetical protein
VPHRHHQGDTPSSEIDLAVDGGLEDAIQRVEDAVRTYLARPGDQQRGRLLADLDTLDEHLATADATEAYGAQFSSVIGRAPDVTVIGDINPAGGYDVEVAPAARFQAQALLVRAAKAQIRKPSDSGLAALRATYDALLADQERRARSPD